VQEFLASGGVKYWLGEGSMGIDMVMIQFVVWSAGTIGNVDSSAWHYYGLP